MKEKKIVLSIDRPEPGMPGIYTISVNSRVFTTFGEKLSMELTDSSCADGDGLFSCSSRFTRNTAVGSISVHVNFGARLDIKDYTDSYLLLQEILERANKVSKKWEEEYPAISSKAATIYQYPQSSIGSVNYNPEYE